MLKVLCIDQGDWNDATNETVDSPLTVGVEYHVMHVVYGPHGQYYTLIETQSNTCFHTSLFVELPEETADEMSQENHEAIVNIENPVI